MVRNEVLIPFPSTQVSFACICTTYSIGYIFRPLDNFLGKTDMTWYRNYYFSCNQIEIHDGTYTANWVATLTTPCYSVYLCLFDFPWYISETMWSLHILLRAFYLEDRQWRCVTGLELLANQQRRGVTRTFRILRIDGLLWILQARACSLSPYSRSDGMKKRVIIR